MIIDIGLPFITLLSQSVGLHIQNTQHTIGHSRASHRIAEWLLVRSFCRIALICSQLCYTIIIFFYSIHLLSKRTIPVISNYFVFHIPRACQQFLSLYIYLSLSLCVLLSLSLSISLSLSFSFSLCLSFSVCPFHSLSLYLSIYQPIYLWIK